MVRSYLIATVHRNKTYPCKGCAQNCLENEGFQKNVTKNVLKCSPKVIMLTNEKKKNPMIVDIEIDFESQILALSCLFTKYKNLRLKTY